VVTVDYYQLAFYLVLLQEVRCCRHNIYLHDT